MSSDTGDVFILSYARTPMGGLQGALSTVKATQLGAVAVKGAVERAGVPGDKVERVFMGWARACRNRFHAPRSTRCAAPGWRRSSMGMIRSRLGLQG
jgi:acetyl-CoA acetyltransferase